MRVRPKSPNETRECLVVFASGPVPDGDDVAVACFAPCLHFFVILRRISRARDHALMNSLSVLPLLPDIYRRQRREFPQDFRDRESHRNSTNSLGNKMQALPTAVQVPSLGVFENCQHTRLASKPMLASPTLGRSRRYVGRCIVARRYQWLTDLAVSAIRADTPGVTHLLN